MRRVFALVLMAALCLVACTLLGDRLEGISDGDHCKSGKQDGDESAVDCGGSCEPCTWGTPCRTNADCSTHSCIDKECSCPEDMVPNLRPQDSITFCIDAHEVSAKQYAAFLADCDKKGDCTFDCDGPWKIAPPVSNVGNCTPEDYNPASDLPVVCVHQCDAFAYCQSLGRRLCGAYTDDSVPPTGIDDPNASEWYNACSNSGQLTYPYESDAGFVPGACNGAGSGTNALAAVGSFASCNYDDVYDLSGNVWEWEDSFSASEECYVRGGSFRSDQNALSCKSALELDCASFDDDIGFRCCSG